MPNGSTNNSIDNAKKHYSSLFTLPSLKKALLYLVAVTVVGASLTAYAFTSSINSLLLGASLFIITVAIDFLVNKTILRDDSVFNLRRTLDMSFYCWLFWIALMVLGTVLGVFFGAALWLKMALIGYAAVVTLRIMVFASTSYAAKWRQIMSALLQPFLCSLAICVYWITITGSAVLTASPASLIILYIVLVPIISYAAVTIFLNSIDRLGKTTYNLPAMNLFKAFLLNWVTDENQALEKHLEEMGEDTDIDVNLLKFDAAKPKAAIAMPLVHPGPFKNIGSSLLPSLLKKSYEEKYSCAACTPLGILGHELDLASQAQNQRIIAQILEKADFQASQSTASPFTRATSGCAIVGCQIFGDTAFISFSMAPQTTEDLPQELGRVVTEEAKRLGLKYAVLVNAHNSLDNDSADMNAHLDALKQAAFESLKKASTLPQKAFKIGSAVVHPGEFTQKQGMGAGGITAIAVETGGQKMVYLVIDGNNMIPSLREEILTSLTSNGFDMADVFTTDTHAVSALSTGKRGYHPVGDVMDHHLLIRIIVDVAKTASSNLEASKVGCIQFTVPKVRVIGEERLNSVSILIDKAINHAKKVAPVVFGAEGLLFILLLLLF
jgi:putative membrane protein